MRRVCAGHTWWVTDCRQFFEGGGGLARSRVPAQPRILLIQASVHLSGKFVRGTKKQLEDTLPRTRSTGTEMVLPGHNAYCCVLELDSPSSQCTF